MGKEADKAFAEVEKALCLLIRNCGYPDAMEFRHALDAYIDARIAEKGPQAVPCPDLDHAKRVDRSIVGPTAREVHEAWRKWYGRSLKFVMRGLHGSYEQDSAVPPPSFPELET